MASKSEYRSKEANDHDAGYHLSKRAWLKKRTALIFPRTLFHVFYLLCLELSFFLDYEVDNDPKELFDDSKEIGKENQCS